MPPTACPAFVQSWPIRCVTTERHPRQRPAPDLVQRKSVATDVNQLWVADMTYVPTWEGFVYLAVVTDVFSRKVVGWAFGVHMTAELVIAALDMALLLRLGKAMFLEVIAPNPVATAGQTTGFRGHVLDSFTVRPGPPCSVRGQAHPATSART